MSVQTINYTRTIWEGGQIITKEGLNNIESGITNIVDKITDIVNVMNGLNYTSNNNSPLQTIQSLTQSDGKVAITYQPIQAASVAQSGVVRLTNVVSASDESYAITPKGVATTISNLNKNDITGFGVDKTLETLTENNGIISATFQPIRITTANISDFPTLGVAAEKNVDTTITDVLSTNIPTTSAILTYINNNISGATSGIHYRGRQGTVPPLEGTFDSGDLILQANTNNLYIYDSTGQGNWYKIGQNINAGEGVTITGDTTTSLTLNLITASTSTLGGIKVGTNLSIDSNGILSATDTTYSAATADTLGLIKVGTNLSIVNGVLSAVDTTYDYASTSVAGLIKVGENLSINANGELSGAYTLASASNNGLMSSSDKAKLDNFDIRQIIMTDEEENDTPLTSIVLDGVVLSSAQIAAIKQYIIDNWDEEAEELFPADPT